MFDHDDVSESAPVRSTVVNRFATWAIGAPLTLILGALCGAFFVFWATNYVFWPIFADSDHVAMIARDWDLGYRPYRDRFTFQLPGEIYLYWVVGKIAGWGNPIATHGVDAGFVGAFCIWTVYWSRKVFGRALPGMVGVAAFLSFYLALEYCNTNQRDWHAAFFGTLAITIPQAWKGRPGRFASAVMMGLALAIRPQIVLLFPAMAVAGDLSARGPGDPWSKTFWAAIEYILAMTAVFVACLIPLFAQGLWGYLVDSLKLIGPGSEFVKYDNTKLFDQFAVLPFSTRLLALVFGLSLVARTQRANRQLGLLITLAMIGFSLYAEISPIKIAYHKLPMLVTWSLCIAYLTQLLLATPMLSASFRLAVVLLMIAFAMPGKPRYASPRFAYHTIAAIAKEKRPAVSIFPLYDTGRYRFDDYFDTIEYIRKHSTPTTKIANMTVEILEGFHGSTGLPNAGFAEPVALFFFPQLGEREAKELKSPGDTIIVWDPNFKSFQDTQPDLYQVILANYSPEARFGLIEVWRRNPVKISYP